MSGSPTVSDSLTREWQALHSELRTARGESLAGLFIGFRPDEWNAQRRRILYVGRATSGAFTESDADEHAFGKAGSTFWSFAKQISKAASPDDRELDNLAWSNIFKIGVIAGTPDERLQLAQFSLAAKTLRRELIRSAQRQ